VYDDDLCADVDCSGHGTCAVAGGDTAVCLCDAGYHAEGTTCVENVVGDECRGVDCNTGGVCAVSGGAPICVCGPGFQALGPTTCVPDEPPPDPCDGVDCSGHGTCAVAGGDTAVCLCDAGYRAEGLTCVESATGDCTGVTCSGHGRCVVGSAGAECLCDEMSGYFPQDLACIDTCEAASCGVGGVCTSLRGGGVCYCPTSYTAGDRCVSTIPGVQLSSPTSDSSLFAASSLSTGDVVVAGCKGGKFHIARRSATLAHQWAYDFETELDGCFQDVIVTSTGSVCAVGRTGGGASRLLCVSEGSGAAQSGYPLHLTGYQTARQVLELSSGNLAIPAVQDVSPYHVHLLELNPTTGTLVGSPLSFGVSYGTGSSDPLGLGDSRSLDDFCALRAQGTEEQQGVERWHGRSMSWRYDLTSLVGSGEALSVAAGPDGGCVVAGRTGYPGTPSLASSEAWVARVDGSGGLMWYRRFGGVGSGAALRLVAASGGFVLAGYSRGFTGGADGAGGGLVARVSASGVVEWQTVVTGAVGTSAVFNDVAIRPDGVLVAAGNYPATSLIIQGHWLVMVDADGDVLP
jgi:hypothetical protein